MLVLFLSFFTFSSNQVNSITLQSNPVFQTEWVYESRRNFNVSTRFRKVLGKIGISLKEYHLKNSAFNELVLIKLTKLAKAFLSIVTTSSFFVQEATVQYLIETVSLH
jgi:hypothetical protein